MASFFISELCFDKMKYYRFASKAVKEMIDIMNEKETITQGLSGSGLNRDGNLSQANTKLNTEDNLNKGQIKGAYLGKI